MYVRSLRAAERFAQLAKQIGRRLCEWSRAEPGGTATGFTSEGDSRVVPACGRACRRSAKLALDTLTRQVPILNQVYRPLELSGRGGGLTIQRGNFAERMRQRRERLTAPKSSCMLAKRLAAHL
jgi:hypothetical protein